MDWDTDCAGARGGVDCGDGGFPDLSMEAMRVLWEAFCQGVLQGLAISIILIVLAWAWGLL